MECICHSHRCHSSQLQTSLLGFHLPGVDKLYCHAALLLSVTPCFLRGCQLQCMFVNARRKLIGPFILLCCTSMLDFACLWCLALSGCPPFLSEACCPGAASRPWMVRSESISSACRSSTTTLSSKSCKVCWKGLMTVYGLLASLHVVCSGLPWQLPAMCILTCN